MTIDHAETVACTAILLDEPPREIDGKFEPNGHSFIEAAEFDRCIAAGLSHSGIISQVIDRYWKGGRSARVTDTTGEYAQPGIPEGVWIEVWMTADMHEQAPFNPPLTTVSHDH